MQTYAVTVSHDVVLLIGPVQSTSVAKRVAREWTWALDASAANEAVVPHTINLNATHLR